MTLRHGKRGGENSAEPGSHKTEQSRAHAPLTPSPAWQTRFLEVSSRCSRLPRSLHRRAARAAENDGVSRLVTVGDVPEAPGERRGRRLWGAAILARSSPSRSSSRASGGCWRAEPCRSCRSPSARRRFRPVRSRIPTPSPRAPAPIDRAADRRLVWEGIERLLWQRSRDDAGQCPGHFTYAVLESVGESSRWRHRSLGPLSPLVRPVRPA